jgi:CRP/FNR family transcriptional regulator, cyclic AMP receptor protein
MRGASPSESEIRAVSAGAEALDAARSHGFLGRLSQEVVDEITESATAIYYPRGSVSLPAGEGGQPAVVLSGLLRYFLATPGGRQITIRYVGVGDLVGTVTPLGPGLGTTYQAIEPSVLLHLDRERMRAVGRKRPEFGWELLEEVAMRLRYAYGTLAATAFTTVRSRVARDLMERAVVTGRAQRGLVLPVTQQALADATGSVREVVARAVRELRHEGVIATQAAAITILDPDALAAEATGGEIA